MLLITTFQHLVEHISSHMHPHKVTHRLMLSQQCHTQQERDIIPVHFDTCYISPLPNTSGERNRESAKKKQKECEAERQRGETNSRRDTCGDLMTPVSSKEPLISSSGPRAAPCVAARAIVTEQGEREVVGGHYLSFCACFYFLF